MRNRCLTLDFLVIVALTAIFSLAAGHLTDLAAQIFSSGGPTTPALIGDVAGLIACAASALYGVRSLRRLHTCG
jgi:hypothetical protein